MSNKRENDLHTAVCQAVGLMNQGESLDAHTILRRALVAYADAVPPEAGRSAEEMRVLLTKIADANVIFPSMCANNSTAYSINCELEQYRTKRHSMNSSITKDK